MTAGLRKLARAAALAALAGLGGLAGTAALQPILTAWDLSRFPPPGELVDIGGRRLHARCAGSGGPLVVLESGGTHASPQYDEILPLLAERTRTCAYDRAGMGWSDPSPVAPTTGALTDDLDQLRLHAGWPAPYVVVAGSAGGLTAELFARRHPDLVAGLVLLDPLTSDVLDASPAAAARLERQACLAQTLSELGLLRWLDPLGRRAEGGAAFAVTYRTSTWRSVCSLLRSRDASAAELRAAPPLRADLPLVVVVHDGPAGLAGGTPEEEAAFEVAWTAAQERFARRSTRGRTVVAAGSGHHVATDRPDAVIDAVARVTGW